MHIVESSYRFDYADFSSFLTFNISSRLFAFNLLSVREIIECRSITSVPGAPNYFRGAINLRGNVIPVLDLSLRIGGTATEVSKRTCIIVVEINFQNELCEIGVLVDSVNQVLDLMDNQLEKPGGFGGYVKSEFIECLGKVDNSFIVVLNLKEVLSPEDPAYLLNSPEISQ